MKSDIGHPVAPKPALLPLSAETLQRCLPNAKAANITRYLDALNAAMLEFGITTRLRVAAFLSQIAIESGSLKYDTEIASGDAYEGRADLGNTQLGDGRRYKGRGLIQLTGRTNYRKVGEKLGLDLESQPEIAAKPEVSARVAGLYFTTRNIPQLSDEGDIVGISRKVNGGDNHLKERVEAYKVALAALPA